ncbi:hypothetical protein [Granulicella sp. dw_53]|uniref:hypothetical protein n=1 Tax=Granulicella sp. dw_53 TaxID=2719792 RepID=UPI001BD59CB1|nr:hypothetical protein [Granulicella sp. dw_53]
MLTTNIGGCLRDVDQIVMEQNLHQMANAGEALLNLVYPIEFDHPAKVLELTLTVNSVV